MEKQFFMKKFSSITDPNTGKNALENGMIEDVEVNEEMKRVYVTICEKHNLSSYVEKRVRDIVLSEGYDPEIETIQ